MRRVVPGTFRGRLILIGLFALAVRVAYALTLGRHSNGLGDFHFYNWTADLIESPLSVLCVEAPGPSGRRR